MNKTSVLVATVIAVLSIPRIVTAQQNVPAGVERAVAEAESTARRFGAGIQGGIGLDPEIIDFGVHATLGPILRPTLQARPGLEFGLGEITTLFAINLDLLYTIPGFAPETPWLPYVGAGPNFSLSHRGFETDDGDSDNVDLGNSVDVDDDRSRFDFSDTDFNGGMNFIVGMRRQNGMFFEMKATAWGVSNVRLLAGFNF